MTRFWDATRQPFSRLTERPPRFALALTIVVMNALLFVIANHVARRLLPPDPTENMLNTALLTLASGLVIWGLHGLILRFVGGLKTHAWQLAAWLFVPGVVVSAVMLMVAWLYPIAYALEPAPLPGEGSLAAWRGTYWGIVQHSAYSRLSQNLSFVARLLFFALLVLAMRSLAPKRTLAVVLSFVALSLVPFFLMLLERLF